MGILVYALAGSQVAERECTTMRNALLAVIGVGVGVWLLLNYSEAFLSRQFWIRWLPVGIPRSPLTLGLSGGFFADLVDLGQFPRAGR